MAFRLSSASGVSLRKAHWKRAGGGRNRSGSAIVKKKWDDVLRQFSRLTLQVVYESIYEERFEFSESLWRRKHRAKDASTSGA